MADGLALGPGIGNDTSQFGLSYLISQIGRDRVMHIEILVTVSAALLGFQALLGSRRRRCGSKTFLLPLWAAYTVSNSVVSYTVGLAQSVDQLDSIQQWWAVGLLLLLGSADALSAFSRHDIEQSKGMHAQHIFQTLLVLWLLFSRGILASVPSLFLPPFSVANMALILFALALLLCWLYSILKMAQRIKALRMASSSHGLVRSAKVVADYMHDTVERETVGDYDPKDMRGYTYLVHGEEENSQPPSHKAKYRTRVPVDNGNVVTIEKIWQPDDEQDELLSSDDQYARALKDTCLSFALFKLLKRRFCKLDIAEAGLQKTSDFVLNGLLAGDYERAFRVVELELSFLYDFLYTKYPALFPTNRAVGVARVIFLLVFLTLLFDSSISANFSARHMKESASTFVFSTFNYFLFIAMIVSIEVMQMLSARYSNWAVVHFVCDYVRSKKRHGGIRRALIKRVAAHRARTSRHWENKLGQYSLLNSYGYHPNIYNAFSRLTSRLMEPTREGRKSEPAVVLRREVKEAVLRSLKESDGHLTNGQRSLREHSKLLWACSLPTHTHAVLVWHIATTLCDHEDVASGSDDEHRHRLVATSLSGYCAYLLAFVPGMLPDHSYTATQILDAVVQEAREHLGDCKDMSEKCQKMSKVAESKDGGILKQGAMLNNELMAMDDKAGLWELLAKFWTEMVLFLAPSESDNADVHAESLARGGEFMTHLWALLTHAGIVDRTRNLAPAPGTSAV